ncbi:hypothetical protein PQX77_015611 [Marasmius sp. AFHP31]|nr:hypothetical protein PQX77_015611 [Marasmius sp. AFHP31]
MSSTPSNVNRRSTDLQDDTGAGTSNQPVPNAGTISSAEQSQNWRSVSGGNPPYPARAPTNEDGVDTLPYPVRPPSNAKGNGNDPANNPIAAPVPIRYPRLPGIVQMTVPPLAEQQRAKFTLSHGYSNRGNTADETKGNLTDSVEWQEEHSSSMLEQASEMSISTPRPQNLPQRTTTLRELGTLVNNVKTSVRNDFRALATKFSMELTDTRYDCEKRFDVLATYLLGLEENITPDKPIPLSPLEQRAYEIYKPAAEAVGELIEKRRAEVRDDANKASEDYHNKFKEAVGESPVSRGPTYYYQRAASTNVNPVSDQVNSRNPPNQSVQPATSAGRNDKLNNPKPKSPRAASVIAVPDEDDIVYLESKKAGKQPTKLANPEVLSATGQPQSPRSRPNDWNDRVSLQRWRNRDFREKGWSGIPDQRIGFDEDSNPVDKDTTPHEVWDRDYQESTHRAAGGNPGDPGGDSSESDDGRGSRGPDKRPPRKSEPKKPHHTLWDDESSSSDGNEYSNDSLLSDIEEPLNIGTDRLNRTERRKHYDHLAKRHELDKLDDYSRRRWTHRIHHKYRALIREHVGELMLPIDGLKSVKVNEPEHYKGEPDVEKFEAWLLKVLRWMAVNRLSGPEADKLRIQCLGMLLDGKASRWYDDEVASPHRTRSEWNFEDAVIGIFDHCVQTSTVHQSATQFDEVKYDPKKGIEDYYKTLSRWASRMTNVPDKYTFKRRFIGGLPSDIIKEMIDRGAVPDYATVKTMVKAVRRHEDDLALENYYLKQARPSANDTKSTGSTDQKDHRNRSKSPSRDKARIINGRRYKLVRRSHSPPRDQGRKFFSKTTTVVSKPTGSKPPYTGGTSGNQTQNDKKQPICYGCGNTGHYASDPKCPQYGKPRLFAIQEEEIVPSSDNGDTTPNEPENESNEQPGDESSDGEYVLKEYEDYGGYIDGDTSDCDWMGKITEGNVDHISLDDIYNPLSGCGPALVIEDEVEVSEFCPKALDAKAIEATAAEVN